MKEEYKLKRNNFSKEKEIISKRGKREKHFLQKDGTIVAQTYLNDIHFEKNGKFEEIDNTLEKVGNYYKNKNNSFNVYFKNVSMGKMMGYELPEGNLSISLPNNNNVLIDIVEDESKLNQIVKYKEIFDGIDFEYKITPTKVKENIIIKNKEALLDEINFKIETDLELKLNNDGSIIVLKDNNILFNFEKPFMIDDNNKINYNPIYELQKKDYGYDLNLILDNEWLKNGDVKYPVIIDPTIIETNDSIMDTYIYPGDNNVSRGEQEILKAGVEHTDNQDVINRALMKFTLPDIGTGSYVEEATLCLTGYLLSYDVPSSFQVNVHKLMTDWNEETADWNMMNDKYDNSISAMQHCSRTRYLVEEDGTISYKKNQFDLTNLVRKWYLNEPNYGIMLKSDSEEYDENVGINYPAFYSSNSNNLELQPYLEIQYKNYNGIDENLYYQSQSFDGTTIYENILNGNLISVFDITSITDKNYILDLKMIYNTNDVILNNDIGYGLGYRLNYAQTITEIIIGEFNYLEYVDDTGKINYFVENQEKTGTYFSEIDNSVTVTKEENMCILNVGDYTMKFVKNDEVYLLSEQEDNLNNRVQFFYDENKRINKISDSHNNQISLVYENNKISVINLNETVVLNYLNNKIINISTSNGNLLINYNDKKLIEKIIDKNGLGIGYEYYEQIPYRIKKVIEYGKTNTIGMFFSLIYSEKYTQINNNDRYSIIVQFDENGTATSTCQIDNEYDISNACMTIEEFGDSDQYKNKLISSKIPISYVKNHLTDISFENSTIGFDASDSTLLSISNDVSFTGINSLKVINSENNQYIAKTVVVDKGKYYTFSAYIKNEQELELVLEYQNSNGETIIASSNKIDCNDEFVRHDVSCYYSEEAMSDLMIKIYLNTTGTLYVDDIQLEDGEIVNEVNYFENSDFSKGLDYDEWQTEEFDFPGHRFNVVSVDNVSALKIDMDLNYYTAMRKNLNIQGNKGDKLTFGFWYKNNGIMRKNNGYGILLCQGSTIVTSVSEDICITNNKWQYVSKTIIAPERFDNVLISFSQPGDINSLYITNFTLYRNLAEETYDYDTNGNIITINDLNNESTTLNYDSNNQMTTVVDADGNIDIVEYDIMFPNKEITSVSAENVCVSKTYDSFDNIKSTKTHRKIFLDDIVDGIYKIRSKGSKDYLKIINYDVVLGKSRENQDGWKIEKNGDYFKIRHLILGDKYLINNSGRLIISQFDDSKASFKFTKKEDGSYLIFSNIDNKYLKNNSGILELSDFDENNELFYQFYIEFFSENLFIEENIEYTSNGLYEKSKIDCDLSQIKVENDPITGLVISETNEKNQILNYEYNDKQKLSLIKNKNMKTSFNYDANGNVSQIQHGQKKYNFEYNDFLKNTSTKIGDNVNLITNNYIGSTDNLSSVIYGNGHTIAYEYDDFERLEKIVKQDDNYIYKYNNNNELAKIVSNDILIKNKYNDSKKIVEYDYNDLKIKYTYGNNEKILTKVYDFGDLVSNINYVYNKENVITKISFDSNEMQYVYDELGRLISNSLNNNIKINYKYLANGKRATTTIKSMDINGDIYKYKYDMLNHITHIYHGAVLENRYYYDEYNQLIKEDNYLTEETIRYKYDNLGNLLFKTVYKLNTYDYVSQNKYQYSNIEWEDQLTKFNEKEITYDAIGNPLTIGDNVTMSWINGKELYQYRNADSLFTYKYNEDGIRTQKVVNGIVTNYYLENNQIVMEQTGNNILNYIRTGDGDLVGFLYNGELYYYVKNIHNDIIAILDSNYNTMAKYQYDSWGNIKAMTDGNGLDISDNVNHIAIINPYRYRSYYYDRETNLYYLQSRYYCPEIGRFINADSSKILEINHKDIIQYNLYVYALNNPVMNVDPLGYFVLRRWMVAVPVDLVLSAIPAIRLAYAPIKTLAKRYAKRTLRNKIQSPFRNFVRTVSRNAEKFAKVVRNGVKKVPCLGNWAYNKIQPYKIKQKIAAAMYGSVMNFILKAVLANIDVFLSTGGAVAGIWDVAYDKKLNNVLLKF